MAKPAAPGLRVRKWSAGQWTDSPDAVVTEEPLQLMLHGQPLSVVMRTPGQDIELCLGLMFAEGILRRLDEVRLVRISAEAGETEGRIRVEADLLESNQIDVHPMGAPRRKPERSMLASSACGV
jgi:FdhD protein